MKRALTLSLLTLVFAVYSLAFAEAFVRAVAPQSFVPREITAAPFGVRMNKPGAVYQQRTPETSAIVRINAEGLRAEREYGLAKPLGVRRIAMFGDSYFLGYEASYDDITSTRLERMAHDALCPVEVLNFSVSGYGTAEMLRMLEAKGVLYHPDVVIFEWHHTDPDDNRRSNLYALTPNGLEPTGATYVPAIDARTAFEANGLYRLIASRSHLFIAVRERASRYVRRIMAGHVFSRDTTGGGSAEPMAGPLDIAILDRAGAVAHAAGAKFYVVDVPGVQSRTRFRSSFRLLPPRVAARANFITPIDAFEAAASNNEMLYWEKGHKHLTPKGNAVIAGVIADHLLQDDAKTAALGCDARGGDPRLARH